MPFLEPENPSRWRGVSKADVSAAAQGGRVGRPKQTRTCRPRARRTCRPPRRADVSAARSKRGRVGRVQGGHVGRRAGQGVSGGEDACRGA